jgi:hypothetical protein
MWVRLFCTLSFSGVSTVRIARCPTHGRQPEEHERCHECGHVLEQVEMVPADYFTREELDWLESAARRAARDTIVAAAAGELDNLARKVARLARGPGVPA